MLDWREPSGFARLGVHFLDLAILIGKPEMSAREIDYDTAGMVVQFRPLMRTVVDVNYYDMLVFKMQFVMPGFYFGGILGRGNIHHQTQNCGCAEKSAQHGVDLPY
jgi:hypothetical protein